MKLIKWLVGLSTKTKIIVAIVASTIIGSIIGIGITVNSEENSKHTHIYNTQAITEASCTKKGIIKHTCTCNDTYIEEVPMLPHPIATTWSYNDSKHWLETSCSCNILIDYAEHELDASGFCIICNQAILPTEGIIYDISIDGTYAEVIGYEGLSTKINIANTYNGLPVKSISRAAFNSKSIISVIIPHSVTSIGYYSFARCNNLISITIPDSVTSIADGAFANCHNLTNIIIPNSVTIIGNYAFYDCRSLTNIIIPNSVTEIGSWTFSYCYGLTSVTISNSITSISFCAFASCNSLISVVIPSSVTLINHSAFSSCDNLNRIYYKGTAEEWNAINIASLDNASLTNATLYYYSEGEPALNSNSTAYDGNFWRYVDNIATAWVYVKEN